jgi:hypothetical protein
MITAYKVLRVRRDGTIGSCFINRSATLPVGEWLKAEDHPTSGFAHKPGWHTCSTQSAPVMTHNAKARKENRYWFRVEIASYDENPRPPEQGGMCYRSFFMRIVEKLGPAFDE